ncbi:MAG: hypothetical protein ACRCWT_00595, partial [Aeromonas veronii]
MGSRNYAGMATVAVGLWLPDVKCKKGEEGSGFPLLAGLRVAAEKDLRLARDLGTDDEGRSTT